MKGRSRLYPISIIMMAAFLAAGPANAVYAAEPNGSWVNLDGNWYWKKTDGTAYQKAAAGMSCYFIKTEKSAGYYCP